MTTVTTIIKLVLELVIIFVLPVLAGMVKYYGRKYAEILLSKIKDEDAKKALTEAFQIVEDSVRYVKQTYVDELKKQGKFDKEAQIIAVTKAKNQALDLMSESVRNALADRYEDVDAFLTVLIESLVSKIK